MTGAIGDVFDELFVAVAVPGFESIQQTADDAHHVQIRVFLVTAHVIAFAGLTVVKDFVDGATVVHHPYPVAHIAAVAVKRYRFVRKSLADDGGNEFLAVLPGAVVVGAVRNRRVHAVRAAIGANEQVRSGFACRIGTVGRIGRFFCEKALLAEASVNFIGGNVMKAGLSQTAPAFPVAKGFV